MAVSLAAVGERRMVGGGESEGNISVNILYTEISSSHVKSNRLFFATVPYFRRHFRPHHDVCIVIFVGRTRDILT